MCGRCERPNHDRESNDRKSCERRDAVTAGHSELGAELLALADTVLTRLEPILRRVAETQQDRDQQGCSWCPVCALAALVRGERHDLVELVASEGAVVVALLRQLLIDHTAPGTEHAAGGSSEPGTESTASAADRVDAAADVSEDTSAPSVRRPAFVPITVRVKE
jgi:hypothetical protein